MPHRLSEDDRRRRNTELAQEFRRLGSTRAAAEAVGLSESGARKILGRAGAYQVKHRVPEDLQAKILEAYRADVPIIHIANLTGWSESTIRELLDDVVPARRRRYRRKSLTPELIAAVVAQVGENKPLDLAQASQVLEIPVAQVREILRELRNKPVQDTAVTAFWLRRDHLGGESVEDLAKRHHMTVGNVKRQIAWADRVERVSQGDAKT